MHHHDAGTARAGERLEGAIVHDAACGQQIERIARKRGVDVKWVNPPLRRAVASND